MSSVNDFVIENGVLTKYVGTEGEVIIPEGVTRIGDFAFKGNTIICVHIPKSVTSIGAGAFSDCRALTSVTIPDSVTSIGGNAFGGCSGLSSVTIPESVIRIYSGAFCDCRSLVDLIIPESVVQIGNRAFKGCSGLTSIKIPEGVTRIEDGLFSGCSSLMNVTIPEGVTSIGTASFEWCRSLTSVTIPESVTSIGSLAFEKCQSLTSVTIPSNVTRMGEAVFRECSCTVKVRHWSPALASALKSIKGFYNCESLAIYTEDMLPEIPVNFRRQALLGFALEKETDYSSDRATSYLDYAQKNAGKLCEYAFEHPALLYFLCEHKLIKAKDVIAFMAEAEKRGNAEYTALLLNYQNELGDKEVKKARANKEKRKEEFLDLLTERIAKRDPSKGIEGMTFVLTGKLYEWESRSDVQNYLESYGARLGTSVTKKTDYLVTNETDSNSEKNRKAKEYGALVIDEDEFNEIIGFSFRDADQITVPCWLREIQRKAFNRCKSLKSVTVPKSVANISSSAFDYCCSLAEIHVDDGNVNYCSIDGVLFDKDQTKLIHCPRGRARACSIPKNVTSILHNAFNGCCALKEINVAAENEEYCSNDGVLFSKNLNQLIKYPSGKQGTYSIPDGVKSIGGFAFLDCCDLTDVTIPASVTNIEKFAFCRCRNLVIHGPAGSKAELFAKENNISFVAE